MSNSHGNNECSRRGGSAPTTRTTQRRNEQTAMDALVLSSAFRHRQQHRDEGESTAAVASSLQPRDRMSRDWLEAPILPRPFYTVPQPNDSSSVAADLGSSTMPRIRQRERLLLSLNVPVPQDDCRPVSRAALYGILQEALEISSGYDHGVASTRDEGQEGSVEREDQERQ